MLNRDLQLSTTRSAIFFFLLKASITFSSIVFFAIKSAINNGYGYINNKKIDKKEVPMFRDIPCNKDIYYANTLIKLNNFGYKESNILGAIILKWVRNNKIGFKNQTTGIFNKETSVIDLTMNPVFDNELEDLRDGVVIIIQNFLVCLREWKMMLLMI